MGELLRERLEAREELQLAVDQKHNGDQKSSQMKVLLSPFSRFPDQSSCGRVKIKSAIEATVRIGCVCTCLMPSHPSLSAALRMM